MSTEIKNWSTFQGNIFAFVETGTGNAIVKAVAGSGKTTTIAEAVKRTTGGALFLAFNKAISTELQKRGVNARTFHSLCYGPVLRAKGIGQVNTDKLMQLVDAHMGDDDARLYGQFARRMVGLARQAGVGCLVPDTVDVWEDIAEHHDLEPDSEFAEWGKAIDFSRKLLGWSNESRECDFDDLLYFAVKDGIALPRHRWLFVDEAQDTNAIQRAILRKLMTEETRLIAVGDSMQSIYGFRGADSDSMDLIADEFRCCRLPLTVSYRCSRAVVRKARTWSPDIQPADTAPEGKVESLGTSWDEKVFRAGDMVVCRTTKPLVGLAYRLIRARIPAQMLGREIGQGLVNLVERMRTRDIDVLIQRLEQLTTREYEKAIAKRNESKAAAVQDRFDTLMVLIESLKEPERTVVKLVAAIQELFTEKKNAVILSTVHKSKGLEAHRVFWLNASACPAKWAKQPWAAKQEENLCYVATTRAISELYLIEEPKEQDGGGSRRPAPVAQAEEVAS